MVCRGDALGLSELRVQLTHAQILQVAGNHWHGQCSHRTCTCVVVVDILVGLMSCLGRKEASSEMRHF